MHFKRVLTIFNPLSDDSYNRKNKYRLVCSDVSARKLQENFDEVQICNQKLDAVLSFALNFHFVFFFASDEVLIFYIAK